MNQQSNFILDRKNTQQLKGFAILLVLLGHTGMINFAGAYGVSIFLLVSGYGLAQSYLKNGTYQFLSKRIDKVLVPYFIITLIWFVIDYFVYHISYPWRDIAYTLFGLKFQSQIDPSMWYITFLLMWYFAFYLIFSLPLKNFMKVILIFLTILLFERHTTLFTNASGAQIYLFEFPVGVVLGLYLTKIKKLPKNYIFALLLIISIVSIMLFIVSLKNLDLDLIYAKYTAFFAGISAILLFSILHILNMKVLNFINMLFEKLGSLSYEIYLIEFMVLMKYYSIFNIDNKWLKFIAFFVFMIIVGYLYQKMVQIIRRAFTKLLNPFNLNKFSIEENK
ncbi:acyltransferase [Lysinibacillus irui]|uniref:acyltransferase n=1 Tax=Lysinibacillus irui TaxID=2998077 RepID=UPI002AD258F1|nr:acyltransferase [Lysinibacillus irui]MEA0565043.1 acyltransferase [Lysinibacillus irui]